METKRTIAVLIPVALTVSMASSFEQAKEPNVLVIFGDDIESPTSVLTTPAKDFRRRRFPLA
jgi:hypothetical protein